MTDTERAKQQRFVVERAVDALVMWARRQGREEVLCDAVAQGVRVPLPAEPPERTESLALEADRLRRENEELRFTLKDAESHRGAMNTYRLADEWATVFAPNDYALAQRVGDLAFAAGRIAGKRETFEYLRDAAGPDQLLRRLGVSAAQRETKLGQPWLDEPTLKERAIADAIPHGSPPDAAQLQKRAYGAGVFTGVDIGKAQAAKAPLVHGSGLKSHTVDHCEALGCYTGEAPSGIRNGGFVSEESSSAFTGVARGSFTVPGVASAENLAGVADSPGARIHDGESHVKTSAQQRAQGWQAAAAYLERRARGTLSKAELVLDLRAASEEITLAALGCRGEDEP